MRWPVVLLLGLLMLAGVAALLIPAPGSPPAVAEQDKGSSYPPPVSPPHQFAQRQEPDHQPAPAPAPDALLTLAWEDLIPADWQPDLLFDEYNLDTLEDDDELAMELLDKLMQVWAEAPVVEELDGRMVRLPGFVVPLDAEPGQFSEFLLVPYFGACIHVPPPPANQTVYIKAGEPSTSFSLDLFATVWVTGTIRAQRYSGELAEAGYTIYADSVEPYEEDSVLVLE